MKYKTLYRVVFLTVVFMLFIPVCRAQGFGNRSSAGINVLYDMQLRNCFETDKVPSDVGASVFVEIPVTYSWSLRIFARAYGFVPLEFYDRCAVAGAGMRLNLNNAIRGELCRGNVYALSGAGIAYSVSDIDGVSFAVNAGVGYSYWVTKNVNIHTEGSISMIGINQIMSCNIGLGCSFLL